MSTKFFKRLLKLNNKLKEVKQYLEGERDLLLCQRDSLIQQKEKLIQERDLLLCQRDSLIQQKEELVKERENIFYKPGHFYSPIPDFVEVFRNKERIFKNDLKNIPGIELNENNQLSFYKHLIPYFNQFPFPIQQDLKYHYYVKNPAFSYIDAITLFSILLHLQPKQLIEVGSGFSSAVIWDTNINFLDSAIKCKFIEPFPDVLKKIFTVEEYNQLTLYEKKLQDFSPNFFKNLATKDILFIDSSHVCKIGSDVNYLFSEILPYLQPGVVVHIHDIHFPFEYPQTWVKEGRAWNEAYMLRSFLQFNTEFEILFWPSFLLQFDKNQCQAFVSGEFQGTGSIWLVRK